MPIYEYRCDNCGHEFETIQKVSEDPLKTCPACAEEALRKKVSAAGFRLKGGGWYETDFKSGSKKNVAGSEAGATADGGAAANGKSDGAGKSGASDGAGSAGKSGSGESGGTSKSSAASSGGTKSD